jgi:hypothetical protein
MDIYEMVWVPFSLVLGGAAVLALTFASLMHEGRTQRAHSAQQRRQAEELSGWRERRAA